MAGMVVKLVGTSGCQAGGGEFGGKVEGGHD